jgi:hypothetical protein
MLAKEREQLVDLLGVGTITPVALLMLLEHVGYLRSLVLVLLKRRRNVGGLRRPILVVWLASGGGKIGYGRLVAPGLGLLPEQTVLGR